MFIKENKPQIPFEGIPWLAIDNYLRRRFRFLSSSSFDDVRVLGRRVVDVSPLVRVLSDVKSCRAI